LDRGKPIIGAYIVWGEHVGMTANEAVIAEASQRQDKSEAARSLLLEILASGPLQAKEIKKIAKEKHISWRTVQDAKKEAGIIAKKPEGMQHAPWMWSLAAE
jgi:hypothetical protein